MRAQGARASPGSPRIQTVIRADPRKADDKGRSTAKLTPLATRLIRKLYVGRRKKYSALLI
jgi:hypothetical protein